MTDVPQKRTAVSPVEAIGAICDAYGAEFGGMPSAEMLAILVSQSALETGNWKSMYNWNFGNMRGSYQGLTQSLKGADEIIDGKRVIVEAGFRAYLTIADGARDFVRFLGVDTTPNNGRPNRYHAAWTAAEHGDVTAYVRELKSAGYFTADEARYRVGVEGLFRKYLPECKRFLERDTEPPDGTPTEPPTAPEHDVPPSPVVVEKLAIRQSEILDIVKTLADSVADLHSKFDAVIRIAEEARGIAASHDRILAAHGEQLETLRGHTHSGNGHA